MSESNEEDERQDSDEEIEESQVMDKLKRSFFTLYDKLKNKITKSDNLKKGVKSFTKSLDRLATASDSRVAKSLFTFNKETTTKKGHKKGKVIPLQSTATARRVKKHSGKKVANLGRRTKDQTKRKQMNIEDEEENVYFSLPRQKKKKPAQHHSLAKAVDENRSAAKKH